MNPRIIKVDYKGQYILSLTFSNNEKKEFDLTPYLIYPVYENLKDEAFCARAKIFNGTVSWNDEVDFDPDILYEESVSLVTV
jgi:hypothetical protein